jgi:hypothetical protein
MQITSTLEAAVVRPIGAASVRVATPDDEGDLIAMLRVMHEEGGMRDGANQPFPISEEKLRTMVQRATIRNRNEPDAGQMVCGIIGEPGQIEASICLMIKRPWYSDMPFLANPWFYVCPEYRRRTQHARMLITFAKALAHAVRMPLRMGDMTAERAEAKERILERSPGVRRFGGCFLYNYDSAGAV